MEKEASSKAFQPPCCPLLRPLFPSRTSVLQRNWSFFKHLYLKEISSTKNSKGCEDH